MSISFDAKRNGYWLSIKDLKYFIDSRVYEDISRYTGLTLLDRIIAYDDRIYESLKNNKITLTKLEKAFSFIKQIEEKEFEEFKKANNL